MILSHIYVYPVKSLTGFSPPSWELTPRGLKDDRRWMVVDSAGKFLSQRTLPQMANLEATLSEAGLVLTHRNRGEDRLVIDLERAKSGRECLVQIWEDTVPALEIQEPGVSEWFGRHLETEAHLVYMPDDCHRLVDSTYAKNSDLVSFADGFPYLIAQESSLEDLSSRLGSELSMLRFRPNLVISGGLPWVEDNWAEVHIGSAVFVTPKPCARCVLVNVDPATGEKATEPLRTLSSFRNFGNKVIFGMNACLQSSESGTVSVGNSVEVS